MFSDYLKSHYDWDTTCAEIASKTGADVERALSRPTGTLTDTDMLALLSPAAAHISS